MNTDDSNNTREASSLQGVDRATGLRVYSIEGHGNYGGGIVIAAATSPEEAARMGNGKSSNIWNVQFKAADAVELLTVSPVVSVPTVIAHYEMGE